MTDKIHQIFRAKKRWCTLLRSPRFHSEILAKVRNECHLNGVRCSCCIQNMTWSLLKQTTILGLELNIPKPEHKLIPIESRYQRMIGSSASQWDSRSPARGELATIKCGKLTCDKQIKLPYEGSNLCVNAFHTISNNDTTFRLKLFSWAGLLEAVRGGGQVGFSLPNDLL